MSNPYMRLFVGDYLGDTQHLTTEQHGAYLLLLMAMWRAGGRLPNNPRALTRITGVHPPHWKRVAVDVMPFFSVDEDGFLVQKRLVKELQKASQKSQSRATSGSAGGRAKALKNNDVPVAIATDLPVDTRAGLPEPEPEIEKKKERNARERASFDESFWPNYPHKVGKPAALKAWPRALEQAGSVEAILAGIRAYITAKPPDRLWLNPATFLNQQRWADIPAGAVVTATGPPKLDPNDMDYRPEPGMKSRGELLEFYSHLGGADGEDTEPEDGEVLRNGSGIHCENEGFGNRSVLRHQAVDETVDSMETLSFDDGWERSGDVEDGRARRH